MPLSTYPFLRGYLLAAVIVTSLLTASAWLGIRSEDAQVVALAMVEAKTSLAKDRTFRLWAAKHGGLYVPVGPDSQPNPFLIIPDRDIKTPVGTLTLRNGATILSELSRTNPDEFGLKTRITALQYVNPENRPDEWEAAALRQMSADHPEYSEVVQLQDKPHLRMMHAMVMEPACLKCHADLGIKLGNIRGATGVAVPLAPYVALRNQTVKRTVAGHSLIWLLGMVGMGWSARSNMQQKDERRRSRLALEQREAQVSLLLNSVSEGVVGIDLQGLCTFINPMALEMLGYHTPDQLIGANFHAMVHHTRPDGTAYPDDACPTTEALLKGSCTRVTHDIFWRADNSSIPVEFSSHPLLEDGQVVGAVVTFTDISRRLDDETHIQMLSSGLEHSANGVLITSKQGVITYSNQSFSTMTGYAPP